MMLEPRELEVLRIQRNSVYLHLIRCRSNWAAECFTTIIVGVVANEHLVNGILRLRGIRIRLRGTGS